MAECLPKKKTMEVISMQSLSSEHKQWSDVTVWWHKCWLRNVKVKGVLGEQVLWIYVWIGPKGLD